MIETFLLHAQSAAAAYGPLALFLIGALEEVIFIIPANAIFMALGFLKIDPNMSFMTALIDSIFIIAVPMGLGVVFGTSVIYGIVYWGGEEVIRRFGGYVGIRWKDIERFRVHFEKGHSDEVAIILARIIPVMPVSIISVICGLFRIGWWEFAWTTFVGIIPRIVGLTLLGWYVGKEYMQYVERINALEHYVFIGGGIIIFAAIVYWRNHRRVRSIARKEEG